MKRFSLLGLLLFFLLNTLNAQDVYVGSKKSDKYHKPDCKWAQKIKPENKVVFKDKEAAEKAGYVACKVCIDKSSTSIKKKSEAKKDSAITSERCQAITKKGTQCKRKAEPGSKYCWQHKK